MGGQLRFFYPAADKPPGSRSAGAARSRASWGRVYHVLIAAGHGRTPSDIGRLTERQIRLFFREEEREERRRREQLTIDMSAAMSAESAAAHLRRLNEGDD